MQRFSGIGMTSQRTRDRLVERLRAKGIHHSDVLEMIRSTPRHIFVEEALASRAYEDTALPIGQGQTISQPYVVARMSEALVEDRTLNRVLEVGTGCGYQSAILSGLAQEVYTVERIQPLLLQARERIYALRINNIKMRHADGNWGWPENAPYDGILVAAAPPTIPQELLTQLAPGGRLVIPVGARQSQQLLRITRTSDGFEEEYLEDVIFVPMLGGTN